MVANFTFKLKNTQKKLFIDETSFQGLLPVLNSHCLPFQAPVVVSGKVYTPAALVTLFYNAHVSVKALTLHFNQSSLENCPSVTAEKSPVW